MSVGHRGRVGTIKPERVWFELGGELVHHPVKIGGEPFPSHGFLGGDVVGSAARAWGAERGRCPVVVRIPEARAHVGPHLETFGAKGGDELGVCASVLLPPWRRGNVVVCKRWTMGDGTTQKWRSVGRAKINGWLKQTNRRGNIFGICGRKTRAGQPTVELGGPVLESCASANQPCHWIGSPSIR